MRPEWPTSYSFPREAPHIGEVPPEILAEISYERIMASRGSTLSLKGLVPVWGYAYCPYRDHTRTVPRESLSVHEIMNFIEQNRQLLEQPDHYLGAWYNDEDHQTYLDVSQVEQSRETALLKASYNHELCIYDLGRKQKILTPYGLDQAKQHYARQFVRPELEALEV